jgi:hypothetical protein
MFKFPFYNYNLLDIAGASMNMAARIREHHSGDAPMLERADRVESTARAVKDAFEGVDTKPATAEIVLKDGVRDVDVRVIERLLQVHMMSPLHTATAAVATELYQILAGEGLDFLNAPFSIESLRLVSILEQFEARPDQLAAVGLTPYVAQLRKSQSEFEAAREQRGALRSAKPEVVGAVRAPFFAAIRATILLLSEPARAEHAAYILEPLRSLRPKTQPATPADPTPAV